MSTTSQNGNGWDRMVDLARAVMERSSEKTGPLSGLEAHRLREAIAIAEAALAIEEVSRNDATTQGEKRMELSRICEEQRRHSQPFVQALAMSSDRDDVLAHANRNASRQQDAAGAPAQAEGKVSPPGESAGSRDMATLRMAAQAKEILQQLEGMSAKAKVITSLIERETQNMQKAIERAASVERPANDRSYERERDLPTR